MVDSLWAPRLIASDIDGTLLDKNHRVTKRNREVIARAVASGAYFALSTGRPFRWIAPVLEQLPVRPVCVTSNGAVIYDSAEDKLLNVHALSPAAITEVIAVAQEVLDPLGGAGFGAERGGTSLADPVEELFVVEPRYSENALFDGFGVVSIDELAAEPAVKLLIRNTQFSAPELYDLIAPRVDPTVAHVTYSMTEGILEVAAPNVTKRKGVSWLAENFGIERSDIIAFGDMPNDIEMLSWVGRGVAMGNAHPAVKEAADEVTMANHQSGVAKVLEQWF
ncbi:HAD family hydrolase [Corynebacterium sp. HMSC08C04]|uniref:HAD hydrolase, IIB family protein n=1 Tax=Corynebacterium simulans TaxID=146827 RepID=A0ABR5V6T9_9CORY|nr:MULTISPECIES: Cof-type HAD-IIB family hydrolase [Corynebacterium]KXU17246.1 HAD hydrolase, IIB family protein [Corynebacterium simulans]OFQ48024.1 HAD family hydrolase [Corynebacterium sp. HMSC076D02]OFR40017.1 HAD family hydrolase [Corynebacterium sp. HMSC077D03]OFT36759.1 HAD family hydrolase [Corynebacterium sp. HMSC08C04]OHO66684.1 HAD family hydrolase [Corynebacterium sp. HMSC036D03]